jgi:hypothetical protein
MRHDKQYCSQWVEQMRAEVAQFGWDNLMSRFGPHKPEDWGGRVAARQASNREMWSAIKAKLDKDFSQASWAKVYEVKKSLGYPLSVEEEKVLAKAS